MSSSDSLKSLADLSYSAVVSLSLGLFSASPSDSRALIGSLPNVLANKVVAEIVDSQTEAWKDHRTAIESAIVRPSSLPDLASSSVTKLDLSGIKSLGKVFTREDVLQFDQSLLHSLKRMPCVTTLVVSAMRPISKKDLALDLPNGRYSLPSVNDSHLWEIGRSCRKLTYLDVSYNQGVSVLGIQHLISASEDDPRGCPLLEKLLVFDCPLHFRAMSEVVPKMGELRYLGFMETGSMIKAIYSKAKEENQLKTLNLTQVNNLGCTGYAPHRCTGAMVDGIAAVNTKVSNVKILVIDSDVGQLARLEHLRKVTLKYLPPHRPELETKTFFATRGSLLISLSVTLKSFNEETLAIFGQNCPNLHQFWFKSDTFNPLPLQHNGLPSTLSFPAEHGHWSKLEILFFRNSSSDIGTEVLPYLLRNAHGLRELMVAVKSQELWDDAKLRRLLEDNNLSSLEKLLILYPGWNDRRGGDVLSLTVASLEFVLSFCPNILKIGNVLSWSVSEAQFNACYPKAHMTTIHEVEIVRKPMFFR